MVSVDSLCYLILAPVPLRLTSSSSGRVDVYYNRVWGTICDTSWGIEDARVVCRQLAFAPATNYYHNSALGQGSGPIWMDNVRCKGSESSLGQCAFSSWDSNTCSHKHDAGVSCTSAGTQLQATSSRY